MIDLKESITFKEEYSSSTERGLVRGRLYLTNTLVVTDDPAKNPDMVEVARRRIRREIYRALYDPLHDELMQLRLEIYKRFPAGPDVQAIIEKLDRSLDLLEAP